MTCDDARMSIIRFIGREQESEDPAQEAHVLACPPCREYQVETEYLWRLAGRARERCPETSTLVMGEGPSPVGRLGLAATVMAAAGLIVWSLSLRTAEAPERPAQDADQKAEELLKKDLELRRRVLQVAAEEKARLAEFEKRLGELQSGYAQAEKLSQKEQWEEVARRSEELLGSFPKIRLAVLDSSDLEFRSNRLSLQLRILATTGQIALLRKAVPPKGDAAESEFVAQQAAVEIKLINTLREFKRQLEELALRGPQPRQEPAAVIGGPVASVREETLDKLRSMRITVDLSNCPLTSAVDYVREISHLNFILNLPKDARERRIDLKMADVHCQAVLEYLAKLADVRWEVDRFGIIVFSPAKR
jgi:hypothetical protein